MDNYHQNYYGGSGGGSGGGGNNLEFQSFAYNNNTNNNNNNNNNSSYPAPVYDPQAGNPSAAAGGGPVTMRSIREAFSTGGADEPPLLEELGINFAHIKTKGLTVLNPFRQMDRHIMDDTDLAGPIVFCFLFASVSLLSGKLYFGYIYGVSVLACVAMYSILNLMSANGIDIYRTTSVLGYCLLPMVLLCSLCGLFSVSGLDKDGYIQLALAAISVIWCTYSSSLMFTTVLSMTEQRALVAYPAGLVYSAFAILAVYPLAATTSTAAGGAAEGSAAAVSGGGGLR